MPRIEALNERIAHASDKSDDDRLCDYTPEEDRAYVERVVRDKRQERWWAEQILYHQRQRRKLNSPLDAWIRQQLDAGRGTEGLGA